MNVMVTRMVSLGWGNVGAWPTIRAAAPRGGVHVIDPVEIRETVTERGIYRVAVEGTLIRKRDGARAGRKIALFSDHTGSLSGAQPIADLPAELARLLLGPQRLAEVMR